MTTPIENNTPEYLAELAHINLSENEKKDLQRDLGEILEYVGRLREVDCESIPPMNGGTLQKNIFREDQAQESHHRGEGVNAFPDEKNGYLKVPPVF